MSAPSNARAKPSRRFGGGPGRHRRFGRRSPVLVTALVVVLLLPACAHALTLEPVGSFMAPIYVASPPGDTSRLFVVERGGTIKLVKHGVTLATPFLTIPASELSTDGERGLLSMAFAADYAQSGRLYTYSTDAGGDIRVDLWRRSPDPDVASPVRSLVLKIEHSARSNHNGGDLHIGPDGHLYISTGDGGGADDPDNNGQTLIRAGTAEQQSTALLGKLLRISPGADGGYAIPADNPFVGRTDARGEIYSYGLRNPFRFSFDRATGDLLLADVGQDDWEEVNYSATRGRGANFGWKCFEGAEPNDGTVPPCTPLGHVPPVFQYDRAACQSITGGYVVRDRGLPSLSGRYLYADFCVGEIRSIVPSTGADDMSTGIDVEDFSLAAFGEDACGRIYVVQLTGQVSRLIDAMASPCPAPAPPPPPPPPPPAAPPPPPPAPPAPPATPPAPGDDGARARPRLTFTISPGRDRRAPFRYTVSGRIVRPSGVSAVSGCNGRASAQTKSGARTISTRRAAVTRRCTFRIVLTFRSRARLGTAGRLSVTLRFLGNAALQAVRAAPRRIRAG